MVTIYIKLAVHALRSSYDRQIHTLRSYQALTTKMSSKPVTTALNPPTTAYEFLGPPGALFITTTVPIVTYSLFFACSEQTGCPPPLANLVPNIIDSAGDPNFWKSFWNTEATLLYFAWYAFCVISWWVLPGDWVEGVTLRTGQKLKYKING